MTSAKTQAVTHSRPPDGLQGRGGGDPALPGSREARCRDDLRKAHARRDLLVSDLAAAEKAIERARERVYDAENEVETRERELQKRKGAPLSDGDERALVASVLGGGALVEDKDEVDPDLVRVKAEASALRAVVEKLVSRLPERRRQLPFVEDGVRAAVKATVAASPAVQMLLDETEVLSLQLIRRRAILASIVGFLPDDGVEFARAAALLLPLVPVRHPDGELWRAAIEKLSRDAGAELPAMIREEVC